MRLVASLEWVRVHVALSWISCLSIAKVNKSGVYILPPRFCVSVPPATTSLV